MNFETWFQSTHPSISIRSALAVVRLAEEGGTVPFIARYRKEQTGNLDEVGIQQVVEAHENWNNVLKRQQFIVSEIENQGKLTPELKEKLLATFEMTALEDLYLPFKKKRKSKATLAKEAGLEPLADWIWNCGHGTQTPEPGQTLELWAFTFRNEEKGIKDPESAIQGAQDILVERLSEMADLRQFVRTETFEKGGLRSTKGPKVKPNSKYEKYFDYFEPVSSLIRPQNTHRYLAIRRGWIEEELALEIGGDPKDTEFEQRLQAAFDKAASTVPDSAGAAVLQKAARLALKAHVVPSISSEVHKAIKAVADETAIRVFTENVRKLLLASPFGSKAVLGVDPGIRTGCKVAVIDDSGKYIGSTVMHLQTDEGKATAKALLIELVKQASIRAIAVGNGTAGRETETFVRDSIKETAPEIPVVMVSEAGASVYSASEAAREEFPELDVTVRGAISIARRLQDPLAELVKIDPKSIGVGQYQHDIAPGALQKGLDFVVDSCVNTVGVNLNTASYHLLAHVAGIGPALAKAIVTYRTEKGLFNSRAQLLDVPKFSTKAFEQAAGFLRIPGGTYPLDNTGVHPERYPFLEKVATQVGKSVADLMGPGVEHVKAQRELAVEIGQFTFDDIIKELEKPGRDPRDAFVPFHFREDIRELKDLQSGMMCPGIVTNVTNFGAFVDIGVHQDGLVHLSQLSDKFVRDPNEIVSPGDRVQVRVLEVNLEKSQIALSMKSDPEERKKQIEARRESQRQARERRAQAQSRAPGDRPQFAKGKPAASGNGARPQHHAGSARPQHHAGSARPQQNAGNRRQFNDSARRPSRPQFTNNPFAAALATLKVNGPTGSGKEKK